mmetsp:Transcript_43017/g.89867  ORF Transcript_43017/g.89867 Transcript_43017/m.89867 type:complete len:205 (+) Transcript_43017:345-959(+)
MQAWHARSWTCGYVCVGPCACNILAQHNSWSGSTMKCYRGVFTKSVVVNRRPRAATAAMPTQGCPAKAKAVTHLIPLCATEPQYANFVLQETAFLVGKGDETDNRRCGARPARVPSCGNSSHAEHQCERVSNVMQRAWQVHARFRREVARRHGGHFLIAMVKSRSRLPIRTHDAHARSRRQYWLRSWRSRSFERRRSCERRRIL